MRSTFEKRTSNRLDECINYTEIREIKKLLAQQNGIESEFISYYPQPNQTLAAFFNSFIGPGDEAVTVGPTAQNIYQAITASDASYFEFYEKPLFLPDSLGLIGKATKRTKLILLGNPNRFTGVLYSQKEIEDILNISGDIMVVLDESSFESSRITALDILNKHDNLALIRTFAHNEKWPTEYIIANRQVMEKIQNTKFDTNYNDFDLSAIANLLKNPGNRLGRIKDARQEMIYMSIRLKMFDLNCFLNPDYSLVIKTAEAEELLFQLNNYSVRGVDMGCFPGMTGYILIPFSLGIDAMTIISIFENMESSKKYYKSRHHRLTIQRPPEANNMIKANKNRQIASESRIESDLVF